MPRPGRWSTWRRRLDRTSAPARAACPECKTLSRKIQRRTVEHLLQPGRSAALREVQYYFCREPACRVVYFSNEENAPFFTTDEVTVKVFAKEQGEDVPVCYCFNWTGARIKQEIRATGESTAAVDIARQIKAGNCACDLKNPKGECCLGDVRALVRELSAVMP
ncbi:MAG: putative iron-sulfur cluster-binding metallochaperone [Saprospiraceae bacterium]